MTAAILELIDKVDGLELVRDQIAAILVVETANQQALATTAGKNPKLWALRVFSEHSNAFEHFEDNPDAADVDDNAAPIVNVWFNSDEFDKSKGDVVERQQPTGTFNVDVYGYGVAKSDGGAGHVVADEKAAFEAQRGARLVRNILMSGQYVVLGLRGLVGRRWLTSRTMFQPALDGRASQRVVGMRLSFEVSFVETSPQVQGQTLDTLSVQVNRKETGQLMLSGKYTNP